MSKMFKCGRLYRSATIRAEDISQDDRTIELSFSSTEPVDRVFGDEILLHGKDNVDLSRLNDGGPLLSDHDMSRQIGVVEKAWLDGGKGRAVIRFSKNPAGEAEFQDVRDGIRRNVSVGYRIHEIRENKSTSTVEVTRWLPLEISLVSIGADGTVGVGRTNTEQNRVSIIEDESMAENNAPDDNQASPADDQRTEPVRAETPPVDIETIRADELKRIKLLQETGRHFGESALAEQAINAGTSVSDFNRQIIQVLKKRGEGQAVIGMTHREVREYSFLRAIASLAFPNDRRIYEAAAYEREVSDAAVQQTGQSARGILVPYDVLSYRAPLAGGTATAAAELVGTDHLASAFIDVLRNRMATMRLGVTMLTGLQGNVSIPKQDSSAPAAWISTEGGDAAEAAFTTTQVALTPKTIGAWTEYTRQLILQSDPSVELLTRNDLAAKIALGIDAAVLYGTGATGQPSGIITLVTKGTTLAAAVPTYGEVVDMETGVAAANADVGSLGYLVDAGMRGSLKQAEKFTNTGMTIWEPGDTLNGYRAEVSNQVTSGDLFFGDWSSYIIGMWGGLDLTVDPYSNSKSGTIRIVAHQSVDGNVRHTESFYWTNDTP